MNCSSSDIEMWENTDLDSDAICFLRLTCLARPRIDIYVQGLSVSTLGGKQTAQSEKRSPQPARCLSFHLDQSWDTCALLWRKMLSWKYLVLRYSAFQPLLSKETFSARTTTILIWKETVKWLWWWTQDNTSCHILTHLHLVNMSLIG